MEIKKYKKEFDYSYALGAFPTIELLKSRPKEVICVYMHTSFPDKDQIEELAGKAGVPVYVQDKIFTKISDKENCFVIGVFKKYNDKLSAERSHVVLVNPSNMGNMGTIMRSAIGFGIKDMAIINGLDVFNPKVVRASMGAIFRINCVYYDTFDEYMNMYKNHDIFCFMLNAKNQLTVNDRPKTKLYSLVFGNEATGLPDSFLDIGTSVIIPESDEVDSLNITIAAGIGMFLFSPYSTKE